MRQLGENVRRLRKERGLSLSDVSSRMTALGVPLSLNGVSKVELGNRDLGLDELVALGAALGAAPLVLIFPLGKDRLTEIFPGTNVDTWAAAKWFTGEQPLPESVPEATWPGADGNISDQPPMYFREQDQLINEWGQLTMQVAMARREVATMRPDMALAEVRGGMLPVLEQTLRLTEDKLRSHRAAMRNAGLDPGELPSSAAHIDAAQG